MKKTSVAEKITRAKNALDNAHSYDDAMKASYMVWNIDKYICTVDELKTVKELLEYAKQKRREFSCAKEVNSIAKSLPGNNVIYTYFNAMRLAFTRGKKVARLSWTKNRYVTFMNGDYYVCNDGELKKYNPTEDDYGARDWREVSDVDWLTNEQKVKLFDYIASHVRFFKTVAIIRKTTGEQGLYTKLIAKFFDDEDSEENVLLKKVFKETEEMKGF